VVADWSVIIEIPESFFTLSKRLFGSLVLDKKPCVGNGARNLVADFFGKSQIIFCIGIQLCRVEI